MVLRTRRASFLIVLATYIIACLIGVQVFRCLVHAPIWAMFWSDVVATLFVWIISTLLKNASVYDPYWSVAPLIMGCYWAYVGSGSMRLVVLLNLFAWGIRLTCNWARRWRGLEHQDWRYTELKSRNPHLFTLINLLGIHMMPTILVFLGLLPVYDLMNAGAPFTLWALPGFLLCLGAFILELVADAQMDMFRRSAGQGLMESGLWRVCRHPNYLGEMLFWWGLWLTQVLSVPGHVLGFTGALSITVLFVFVSVPLMDRHMLSRDPQYALMIQRYPALLPWRLRQARTETLSLK